MNQQEHYKLIHHIDIGTWDGIKMWSEREIYILPAVCNFLECEAPNKRVLDIGCGTGDLCKIAAKYGAKQVDGFDIQEDMIEAAKRATSDIETVRIRVGDQINMPYGNNSFDVATSVFVLCYSFSVEVFNQFFKELYRVLSPGGKAIILNKSQCSMNTLYLAEGADQLGVEETIKKILAALPNHPTKEQVNEALNVVDCQELFLLHLVADKNGRMHRIKDPGELSNSQPTLIRYSNYTFANYYYSDEFTIDSIKAAGLRLDQVEIIHTEERRIAYNNTNPKFKHSDTLIKRPLSLTYHVSKPL